MKKHRVFFLAAAAGAVLCLCPGLQTQVWAPLRRQELQFTATGLLFLMRPMRGMATV